MTRSESDEGALANVQFRQVGKPLTRTDAPGKVTGRTPYAGDYASCRGCCTCGCCAPISRAPGWPASTSRSAQGAGRRRLRAHRRRHARPHRGHRHSRPDRAEEAGYRSADPGRGTGPLFRRAACADRRGDPRSRRAGGGPDRGRAEAASGCLRPAGGPETRRSRWSTAPTTSSPSARSGRAISRRASPRPT